MDLGLDGRVALVTGGSRGIGSAIALRLAREGMDVAICARNEETLQAAATAIRAESGRRVWAHAADMREPDQILEFVNRAADVLGGIDVLVNNAVESVIAPLVEMRDEDIVAHLNVKVMGYLRASRAAVPHMRARGGGHILMIGGMAVRSAGPGSASTGIANAAIVNMAKILSKQLAPSRIRVNVIHPSEVITERILPGIRRRAAAAGMSEPDYIARMAADMPLGRLVTSEDIAHFAAFLSSDMAGSTTGQSIGVDGGGNSGVYY